MSLLGIRSQLARGKGNISRGLLSSRSLRYSSGTQVARGGLGEDCEGPTTTIFQEVVAFDQKHFNFSVGDGDEPKPSPKLVRNGLLISSTSLESVASHYPGVHCKSLCDFAFWRCRSFPKDVLQFDFLWELSFVLASLLYSSVCFCSW